MDADGAIALARQRLPEIVEQIDEEYALNERVEQRFFDIMLHVIVPYFHGALLSEDERAVRRVLGFVEAAFDTPEHEVQVALEILFIEYVQGWRLDKAIISMVGPRTLRKLNPAGAGD